MSSTTETHGHRTADAAMQGDQRNGDEISLADLVRAVWKLRWLLILGTIIPVLLAGAWLLTSRVTGFERATSYVIEFRFEGRSEDQYPNGLPFSLGNIVAPATLAAIYESEGIADYGMSFRDFQTAISIAPYTPDRRLIMEKYTQDSRRATVAEINEAQAALNRELEAAQRRYAVIGFTTTDASIPQAKIDRVLIEVPRAWERYAIENRGALRIDTRMINPDIFLPERIDGLDRLNGLRYLRNALDELSATVNRIAELPGGLIIREPESNNDVSALRWLINRAALQLIEVPAAWSSSESNIVQADAQGLPISVYPPGLFNEADLEGQDYLISIDILRQRMRLVRDNVSRILSLANGDAVRDPVSGLSARDIDRLLFDLDEFTVKLLSAPVLQLGISNNSDVVRLYYDSRLQELQRDKQTLAGKARIVEQAIQNYQGMTGGAADLGTGGSEGAFPSTSTVIPQFGDAFIDRLIELSQRGGDTQFRQDLLQQVINYQREATDLEAEIARIQEYIRVFTRSAEGSNVTDPVLVRQFTEQLRTELPQAMGRLREYADITTRIAYRLRYAQDIHGIVSPEDGGAVNVDYYLRDLPEAEAQGDNRRQVLGELRQYAATANRLYAEISSQALGTYQRLFRAVASPEPVRQSLVSRYELLVLLLAGLVGAVLALLAGLMRNVLGSRPAA